MDTVRVVPSDSIAHGFLPERYLPPGHDEYTLREAQLKAMIDSRPVEGFRHLAAGEIDALVKNGNTADGWENVLVSAEFEPTVVRNSHFFGLVRIGTLRAVALEHHALVVPVGITDSTVVACDIGDLCAVHNVPYLAHYIVGSRCIILNVGEMHVTNHAKFGNGIVKEGEPDSVRITLDLINEAGTRAVCPFDGMLTADAYLWAKYRDDTRLMARLVQLTDRRFDPRRGYYGTVGPQTVIKNSRTIKDVKIGDHCYIKGANKLKNLTVHSSEEEPTQIGEGVELVNGIVGYGCRIFYGSKAVRFIMGTNSSLTYGARLIHSYLGDNSTVSCCELLNNLIFPAHEQHHNNSFLVASVVLGQSNIAAGATIGSNHNSRSNDNEIEAGRGFWPGLCTSLKHSSRFASFVLLAKADYPAELNIPLPFSLVSSNITENRLEVMPAFWWLHNMYAMARNGWKFATRDRRITKRQRIEFESLAPDTVEEIIAARTLLEEWTGRAIAKPHDSAATWRERGRAFLHESGDDTPDPIVHGHGMERTRREQLVLRPCAGYQAYREMLVRYASQVLVDHLASHPDSTFDAARRELAGPRTETWVNLGGQLVPGPEVDRLRADIGTGRLDSWDAVHERYDELWARYPDEKRRHAYAVFRLLYGDEASSDDEASDGWLRFLDEAVAVQELVCDRVYASRKKDYDNPFRQATYRSEAEMTAALGSIEENEFVKLIEAQTEEFRALVLRIRSANAGPDSQRRIDESTRHGV